MNFEQKLHAALFENFRNRYTGKGPKGGHEVFTGYLPYEFDQNEPEVEIEYDWEGDEPTTRDYPGSPGGVFVTNVRLDGRELNIDTLPPEMTQHLEEQAGDDLTRKYQDEQDAMADRADTARDEHETMRQFYGNQSAEEW